MPRTDISVESAAPVAGTWPGASKGRRAAVGGVIVALSAAAWMAAREAGGTQAALLLTGAGMGLAIGHSGFGFAGAWRSALMERRGAGLRAQLALLAILTVIFFPLLASGSAFGTPLTDIVRPVGVSLIAGAFLFGVGAQFASACSSGSLCALGDAKPRYLIVVASMVAGATLGSAHFGWWESQPRWAVFSLVRDWGPAAGIAVNLGIIGFIAAVTIVLERARHGSLLAQRPDRRHWLRGPWPVSWGVIALAVLCAVTLIIAGRPWNIISALPLWGARIAESAQLPVDVTFWDYWAGESRIATLEGSLWLDVTTVMIIGLVLGSMLASALAGRLALLWRIRPGEALGATAGGLLLGYGGVVGLGCNIGAFLGGVSSGSLHGWVWLAAALAGTAAGIGILSVGSSLSRLLRGDPRALSTASARQ